MTTMTEATEATDAATNAFKTVSNIQGKSSNPNKVIIRNAIKKQVMSFVKHQKHMFMFSLPATDWIIERELATDCDNNNIDNCFVGIENDKNIFPMVQNNKPKGENFSACLSDFDALIKYCISNGSDCSPDDPTCNVFWADYCGNFSNPSNSHGERHPHLNTFFYAAKTLKTPFLYYMTFSLMARHEEGRKGLSAIQYAWRLKQAIQIRYQQMIDRKEISPCIIPIFSSVYRGAGISDMITIGFAVNVAETEDGVFWNRTNSLVKLSDGVFLEGVNANLLNKPSKPVKVSNVKATKVKAPAKIESVPVDYNSMTYDQLKTLRNMIDTLMAEKKAEELSAKKPQRKTEGKNLRKIAIKILHDSELFDNGEIATVLGLSRNQVGAILAHHCHPESFKK
jgi:hypothetical protein